MTQVQTKHWDALEWDVPTILDTWPSLNVLVAECVDQEVKPPGETQHYYWKRRKSIPADWVATLMYVAMGSGRLKSPTDWMVKA